MSMGYAIEILRNFRKFVIASVRKGECEFSLTGLLGLGSSPISAICLGSLICIFVLSDLRHFCCKPIIGGKDRKAMKKTEKRNPKNKTSFIESMGLTLLAVGTEVLSGALSG